MASIKAFVFVENVLITQRISLQNCSVYLLQDYTREEADLGVIKPVVSTLLRRSPDDIELVLDERQRRQNCKHHCVLFFLRSIDKRYARFTWTWFKR